MLKVEYAAVTNVGKVRKNNEDNYYVNGYYKKDTDILNDAECGAGYGERFLFSVCDGMGGIQFGEVASLAAVKAVSEYRDRDFDKCCSECVKAANDAVCDFRESHNNVSTGTTFTSLYLKGSTAHIANVGDSRVYILRGGKIAQLSEDHTEAQLMIDAGVLDPARAKYSRASHALTQNIGLNERELIIEPCVKKGKTVAGDIFLLCSDGLTDMLDDDEIERILNMDAGAEDIAKRLVKGALDAGGRDNVTVAVVKVLQTASKTGGVVPKLSFVKKSAPRAKKKGKVPVLPIVIITAAAAVAAVAAIFLFGAMSREDGAENSAQHIETTEAPKTEEPDGAEQDNPPAEDGEDRNGLPDWMQDVKETDAPELQPPDAPDVPESPDAQDAPDLGNIGNVVIDSVREKITSILNGITININ